ncbi:transmembrane protein 170B isoform X8 [Oryctolagus cuniculus]
MSPRRGGGCLGDTLSGPPRRPSGGGGGGGSSSARPGAPQPPPAAWRSRALAAAPRSSQPPPPGAPGEGGGRPPGTMKAEGGDHSMINLSVQQVLSLWAHGTVLRNLTAAKAEPNKRWEQKTPSKSPRDVVLDLPLGSLLLAVRPWCCGGTDVCDAAEAQAGEGDLSHCRQPWISGFCHRRNDH